MDIKINNNYKPFWNDNSLCKISKSLFTNLVVNNANWTNITNITTVTNFDYDNCTIQILTSGETSNLQSAYYFINVNGTNFYYFADTITLDNISTQPVATVTLKLDKWGTCVSNLNSDFNTWETQVLATNKEINLNEFWQKGVYDNESSYLWLKNVYQNINVNLIRYQDLQLVYPEQTNASAYNWNQQGYNYYYYKVGYLVTAYNNTNTPQTITHIAGNLKDYYTYQTQTGNTSMFTSNLANYINNYLPFVFFAPVTPWNQAQTEHSGIYTGATWTIPFLLSFSTDKDIGLIQLPFSLTNKNLQTINEFTATGNEFLSQINTYTVNGVDYYWPTYYSGANNTTGGSELSNVIDYLVDVNGINIWQGETTNYSAGYGSGWNGGWGYGSNRNRAIDSWIFGNLYTFGLSVVLDNASGLTTAEYNVGFACLMCPMLFNYISFNFSYMGQTITYDNTYCNNVISLMQPYYASGSNENNSATTPNPVNLKFSANYPNLSLNLYASDNIKQSANTPIGQINLSTAFLPNTTNPSATFKTNEQAIINNAATLKNLEISRSMLGWLGGLGLNSLLNPLSLFTSAASVGLDVDSININYSNSFGKAKFNELGHSNTLQTAGDNLGMPDNLLCTYWLVPGVSEIGDIIAQVDKYGYLFHQWDSFNNLFANYYHNYIKLTQNVDLLVYSNANNLLKSWQEYLINQFLQGVIIWTNLMEDGTLNFFNKKQFMNDLINGANNYFNPQKYNIHYYLNFKRSYNSSTLLKLPPKISETIGIVESIKTKKEVVKFINKCKKL